MAKPEEVSVRFDDTRGLTQFAVCLREHRMSYTLAGDNTVVVATQDFEQLKCSKLAVLKDFNHAVEPVVPFFLLPPDAQQRALAHRLLPKVKVVENIRARLAKLRTQRPFP